jgi:DNA repair exonuclease SbcCD ATPase subunit
LTAVEVEATGSVAPKVAVTKIMEMDDAKSALVAIRTEIEENESAWQEIERSLEKKLCESNEAIERLKVEMMQDAKNFEARLRAKQAEVHAVRNLLGYHRRQFEAVLKEKEEYVEQLEDYIAELEAERKSLRKLIGVAFKLIGSRIGLL